MKAQRFPDFLCRDTSVNFIGRNVTIHDRTSGNDCSSGNPHTVKDFCPCTDPDIVTNLDTAPCLSLSSNRLGRIGEHMVG